MNFLLFILFWRHFGLFRFSCPDPKHWLTGRLIILYIGVADPDSESGAFLNPGSGIRNG
jgi:hypothetical protein